MDGGGVFKIGFANFPWRLVYSNGSYLLLVLLSSSKEFLVLPNF